MKKMKRICSLLVAFAILLSMIPMGANAADTEPAEIVAGSETVVLNNTNFSADALTKSFTSISVSFDQGKGNNVPAVNDNEVRVYYGNIMTVTPHAGYTITSIEFTTTKNQSIGTAIATTGTVLTNATHACVSGDQTATFYPIDGTKEIVIQPGVQFRVSQIKVTYEPATDDESTTGTILSYTIKQTDETDMLSEFDLTANQGLDTETPYYKDADFSQSFGGFTVSFGPGSSTTDQVAVYANEIRVYAGNTMTITPTAGNKIASINISSTSGKPIGTAITNAAAVLTNATSTCVYGDQDGILYPIDGTEAVVIQPGVQFRATSIVVTYEHVTCTDAEDDGDHKCDICGEAVADAVCTDTANDGDHLCDECKQPIESAECTDTANDGDHNCDECKQPIESAECTDTANDGDHNCDECKQPIAGATCTDSAKDGDHNCDECKLPIAGATCTDADNDGDHKCDDCGADDVSDHIDDSTDGNHLCDECATYEFGHADGDNDKICDECREPLCDGEHLDLPGDEDHKCDRCGMDDVSDCADPANDGDHLCDECEQPIENAECTDADKDGNHLCDECEQPIAGATCTDAEDDNDHYCDECGETLSDCADAEDDDDHNCDVCGETLSDCADAEDDDDHNCEVCGETLSDCADAEDDDDHNCDVCGETLSDCADADNDGDHNCDVCGETLSDCADADNDGDHNCDVCGAENVTEHTYTDGTCTECGEIESYTKTVEMNLDSFGLTANKDTETNTPYYKDADFSNTFGNFTVSFGNGISEKDQVAVYGNEIRVYAGNTMTIAPEEGYKITSIVITSVITKAGKDYSIGTALAADGTVLTNATATFNSDGTVGTFIPADGTEAVVIQPGVQFRTTSIVVTYEPVTVDDDPTTDDPSTDDPTTDDPTTDDPTTDDPTTDDPTTDDPTTDDPTTDDPTTDDPTTDDPTTDDPTTDDPTTDDPTTDDSNAETVDMNLENFDLTSNKTDGNYDYYQEDDISKSFGNFTVSFAQGDGNQNIAVYGNEIRVYAGNTMTISPEEGYKITSIVISSQSRRPIGTALAADGTVLTNATATFNSDGTVGTFIPADGTEAVVIQPGVQFRTTSIVVTCEPVSADDDSTTDDPTTDDPTTDDPTTDDPTTDDPTTDDPTTDDPTTDDPTTDDPTTDDPSTDDSNAETVDMNLENFDLTSNKTDGNYDYYQEDDISKSFGNFTVSFAQGDGNQNIAVYGNEIRVYAGNTMTIAPEEGYKITSIVISSQSRRPIGTALAADGTVLTNATATFNSDGTVGTFIPADGTEAVVIQPGVQFRTTSIVVTCEPVTADDDSNTDDPTTDDPTTDDPTTDDPTTDDPTTDDPTTDKANTETVKMNNESFDLTPNKDLDKDQPYYQESDFSKSFDSVTVSIAQGEGGQPSAAYGNEIRVYVNNTLTIAPKEGYKITSIVISSQSKKPIGDALTHLATVLTNGTSNCAAGDTDATITPVDGTKAVVIQPGTQFRATSIVVTYELVSTDDDSTDTEKPGTDEPDTETPDTEEPGTEEPGTKDPVTEEPETEEPNTDKANTETVKMNNEIFGLTTNEVDDSGNAYYSGADFSNSFDAFSVSFGQGSGKNKIAAYGNEIRVYAGNTLTIAPKEGYKITSIVINSQSKKPIGDALTHLATVLTNGTSNCTAGDTDATITPVDGTKAVVIQPGTQFRATSIVVTYELVSTDDDSTDTEQPGTEEPGTEEPGTEEPGTEEPGTEEPGTEEPGTDKANTDTVKMNNEIFGLTTNEVDDSGNAFYKGEDFSKNFGSFTVSFGKGISEKDRIAAYGNEIRVYAGNTLTIAPKEGYKITSIVINSQSKKPIGTAITHLAAVLTNCTSNCAADETMAIITPIDGTKAVVIQPGTQFRVTSIEVTYEYIGSPDTGDSTNIHLLGAVMLSALCSIAVLLSFKKKYS